MATAGGDEKLNSIEEDDNMPGESSMKMDRALVSCHLLTTYNSSLIPVVPYALHSYPSKAALKRSKRGSKKYVYFSTFLTMCL